MDKSRVFQIAAGSLLSFAIATAAVAGDTRPDPVYKAEKERIDREYDTAEERCDSYDDNAKDICLAEAKGGERSCQGRA